MIGAVTAYLGLGIAFIGLLGTIHPIRRLRLTTHLRGALLLLTGVIVVAVALSLPARDVHVAELRTRLDEFAPVYQFNEVHAIRIAAAPEQVYQAMRAVTADEISFFKLLTWLRRFGRPGPREHLECSRSHAASRRGDADGVPAAGRRYAARDSVGHGRVRPPSWQRT